MPTTGQPQHLSEDHNTMKRISKGIIASGLVGASFAGGAAFAAWTATGTGNGFAKAGQGQAVTTGTVDLSAATTGLLYPTGSGDVKVNVANPNPYKVHISSIAGNGAIVSGDNTCDASNGMSFATQTNGGAGWDVPGGTLTQVITLTGAASMSNASVDACQGKTFTIPVSLTALSAA